MLNHTGTQTLTTERLILRRFRVDDAQAMYDNWATDRLTHKHLPWEPHESIEETRSIISQWVAGYDDNTSMYLWVIELKGTGIIGTISVHSISDRHMSGDFTFSLGSRWWNHGYMTEAVKAVIAYMFDIVGMHRIGAWHDVQNVGSGRVMQKVGMVHEGTQRECELRRDGTFADGAGYGILRSEYNASKS